MTEIQSRLFAVQDLKYRDFSSKLMPTINPKKVIGVKVPVLRKLAAEIYKSDLKDSFMNSLPHEFYEENNLHGFLIEKENDFEKCIAELDRFLPYIDNWATCDGTNPKILSKYPEKLLTKIHLWLKSDHTYTVRYAIKLLMSYFLDSGYKKEYSDTVSKIKSDEYYIKMIIAWYFATALAKQYETIIRYFESPVLEKWTHNKSIQKAIESFRITPEQKKYLRTLRIK